MEYSGQGKKLFGGMENYQVFKRKIIPIYTGVTDFEKSTGTDIRKELCLTSKNIILVMASNIVPAKGQLDLIYAMEKLVNEFPHLHLLLAGTFVEHHADSMIYFDNLRKYVAQNKLSNYVHFLGWRSDIQDIIQASDIYVSSSYGESFPVTVREAMLASKSVVVTNVGGTFELVNSGKNGYLFEPGDVHSLVEYIRELILDPNLRMSMGAEGNRIINERFSTKVYVRNFENMVLNS